MLKTIESERVAISQSGSISLPEHFREQAGFAPGDDLMVVWLPPDTFLLRKWSDIVADDDLFSAAMDEFRQTLALAGYQTSEDIQRLVQEIKLEQYHELAQEPTGD